MWGWTHTPLFLIISFLKRSQIVFLFFFFPVPLVGTQLNSFDKAMETQSKEAGTEITYNNQGLLMIYVGR